MSDIRKLDPEAALAAGPNKALETPYPLGTEYVARLRRVHPDKPPGELLAYVGKWYLGTVTVTGVGAGAAAIIPNGLVQVPVALADLLTFLETSVLYTLSAAEVHGTDAEDYESRRLLVTVALVGDSTAKTVLKPLIGRTAPYWGRKIV
ncbi:MAG: hypothetical protein LBI33_00415 [Propionibacteriaceae bacterium]|nr:hypothetical protein [Propionibacteriaceae bacterium]